MNSVMRRQRAVKKMRAIDVIANSIRLVTRTATRIIKSIKPASIVSLLTSIMLISIVTNIVDSTYKTMLEISTNLEPGLLYTFKVLIPLTRLGFAIVALSMLSYTAVFNTIDMLLGAINKLADVAVAAQRHEKNILADKWHDFLIAAATVTGASLMLGPSPVLGEILFLTATYYFIFDAFAKNPLRHLTAPTPDPATYTEPHKHIGQKNCVPPLRMAKKQTPVKAPLRTHVSTYLEKQLSQTTYHRPR